ncbi:hypothetical protein [Anaeromyxobacter diazotrophicus]|uniref:Uncharacterized protein n=1 Tax=Anaeromyxobacter diazotrophicus TaxID=2590199 RepID=A0A7I9VKU2_9BACT|nr:hypothetical protein [Anaeromyxobacter diazotrophicus]GEJ56729.1 hypothetical protein AMYX_14700 [Anaeromyxobacter diazotrophicus]
MLAYVFWHWPLAAVSEEEYLQALAAFHQALQRAPPPGFRGSRVVAVEGAPWCGAERAFEDWYLVDDFAALGALNEAAIAGARRAPHDAAARRAAGGAGGVYRRLAEGKRADDRATWLAKPSGVSYGDFLARLPPGTELWQRQLVLGPAPEFHWAGPAPAGVSGLTLAARERFTSAV